MKDNLILRTLCILPLITTLLIGLGILPVGPSNSLATLVGVRKVGW